MDELLAIAPNATDCLSQYSDKHFRIVIGPSGTAPPQAPVPALGPTIRGTTVSDLGMADYVSKMFSRTVVLQDPQVESGAESTIFLSSPEAEFLMQIWRDLDELPEPVRCSSAAALCHRFVEGVGMALVSVPGARCAVFGDEEDGVELVSHSRASMRQVSFEFRPDENSINIISIDEKMQRFERPCGLDKVRTLAEAIAWLNPR